MYYAIDSIHILLSTFPVGAQERFAGQQILFRFPGVVLVRVTQSLDQVPSGGPITLVLQNLFGSENVRELNITINKFQLIPGHTTRKQLESCTLKLVAATLGLVHHRERSGPWGIMFTRLDRVS